MLGWAGRVCRIDGLWQLGGLAGASSGSNDYLVGQGCGWSAWVCSWLGQRVQRARGGLRVALAMPTNPVSKQGPAIPWAGTASRLHATSTPLAPPMQSGPDSPSLPPPILPRPPQVVKGLQTDAPLKRAIKPLGGVGVVKSALQAYGYELPKDIEYTFTNIRKTHNQGACCWGAVIARVLGWMCNLALNLRVWFSTCFGIFKPAAAGFEACCRPVLHSFDSSH
jgi:hypothetical protein